MIVAHPLGVVPDNLLQLRAFADDRQGLVDLLLAFTEDKARVRVIDDVAHLIDKAILKEPYPDTTGAQGGHLGPESLGAVVSDHGDLVLGVEAQLDEAQGDELDVVQIRFPADGTPDAELLFAHGDPLTAVFAGLLVKQLGNRQLFRDLQAAGSHIICVLHTGPLHPSRP